MDPESEIFDATSFVEASMFRRVLSSDQRRGVVARWVTAKLEGKSHNEARTEAFVGMSFLAMVLARVIVLLLIKWWDRRQ